MSLPLNGKPLQTAYENYKLFNNESSERLSDNLENVISLDKEPLIYSITGTAASIGLFSTLPLESNIYFSKKLTQNKKTHLIAMLYASFSHDLYN